MDDNGNDDGGQPTHGDNDRLDHNTPHPRLHPTDAAAPTTVSLAQRAPTAPIPTRTWIMYLRIKNLASFNLKYLLGKKNHCIRSQTVAVWRGTAAELSPALGFGVGQNEAVNHETVGFPYPSLYLTRIRERLLTRTVETRTWGFGFQSAFKFFECGISREWEFTDRVVFESPIYMIVGFFPRGHSNPQERVVFVHEPNQLFWKLCWAAFRLRGMFGTFLSLRHIKGFRIYKVCI